MKQNEPVPFFGKSFTEHMFIMKWNEQKQWHNQCIIPIQNLDLKPMSIHMHYGQSIFEGIKAFKDKKNRITIFRPLDHLTRLNNSARIMCMPQVDVTLVHTWLQKLIEKDQTFLFAKDTDSLYIRPTMIATENSIYLEPSKEFTFFIILSPVKKRTDSSPSSLRALVQTNNSRVPVGTIGKAKTTGNYAASMQAFQDARAKGYDQVLWLNPQTRTHIDELGNMNIFFVIENQLITPKLTASILPGITRNSVIKIAQKHGIIVVERKISIQELIQAIKEKRCTEIFGTGTAMGIIPISVIGWKNKEYTISNQTIGKLTTFLSEKLTFLQRGTMSYDFGNSTFPKSFS